MRTLRFLAPTGVVLLAFALAMLLARFGQNDAASGAGRGAIVAPRQRPDGGVEGVVLPAPRFGPDEVVELQLTGLANQKQPAVGILQCYYFASPANLAVIGTLDAFGRLVRRPPYHVLSNPRAWLVGTPRINGRTARVTATIVDASGRLHCFAFLLERQSTQPYLDCWMTDSVLPVGENDPTPPVSARPQGDS
ncbi:MAG: hypothetical protein KDA44_07500 [Planctomycetales bacterium]|nr:hypothetical protein [Planctomycetales bacterium]